MKFWLTGKVERGLGPEGILFAGQGKERDTPCNPVFSIHKLESDMFQVVEECDGYFWENLSKEDAIAALEEAIEWIKQQ